MKNLESPYEPGIRTAEWLKLKKAGEERGERPFGSLWEIMENQGNSVRIDMCNQGILDGKC